MGAAPSDSALPSKDNKITVFAFYQGLEDAEEIPLHLGSWEMGLEVREIGGVELWSSRMGKLAAFSNFEFR